MKPGARGEVGLEYGAFSAWLSGNQPPLATRRTESRGGGTSILLEIKHVQRAAPSEQPRAPDLGSVKEKWAVLELAFWVLGSRLLAKGNLTHTDPWC